MNTEQSTMQLDLADQPPTAAPADYDKMSTVDLRILVRQRGLAKGAAVAVARKPDLIALLTGAAQGLAEPVLAPTPAAPRDPAPAVQAVGRVNREPTPAPSLADIKLTAKGKVQERFLAHLRENASAVLAEKINTGTKTLAGAERYVKEEARKHAKDGMACIEDDTVFGWVVHYFEEAHLNNEPKAPVVPAGVAAKAPAKAPAKAVHKRRTKAEMQALRATAVPAPVEPAEKPVEAAPAPAAEAGDEVPQACVECMNARAEGCVGCCKDCQTPCHEAQDCRKDDPLAEGGEA